MKNPKLSLVRRVVTPIHPTVRAEFKIYAVPALAGDHERFFWFRGDLCGDEEFTQASCEKMALAHLRSLPAK